MAGNWDLGGLLICGAGLGGGDKMICKRAGQRMLNMLVLDTRGGREIPK